jgi:hypothetical protein
MSQPLPPVSPGVRDVLDRIPTWYEQWGTAVVALVLAAALALAALLRYPEVRLAPITLTLSPAPQPVASPAAGTLWPRCPESTRVAAGTPLATLRPADTRRPAAVLAAPRAGRLAYLGAGPAGQVVAAGQVVFAVVPETGTPLVQGRLPAAGAGQVRVGQRVLLDLDAYPAAQFGTLSGTVATVAPLPVAGTYRLTVRLPQGLRTSTGQQLPLPGELAGTARIIVQESSLLGRLARPMLPLLRGRF